MSNADAAATSPDDDHAEDGATDDDGLEELRQAAGAVIASLKGLVDAVERVVEDPHSFDQIVAAGRGLVDAFTTGLTADEPATERDPEGEETL